MTIYQDITQLIGKTPMVRINKMANNQAEIIVKVESFNPASSVKDRVGMALINDAEKQNLLQPGATIIEPTSGNTGIGLALVSAVKGYHLILTMPDSMSLERQRLLKALGAELILTPGKDGMLGSIAKAEELLKQIPGSFIPQQFNNPANPQCHFETTGPEIWQDTDGKIDVFVAGVGTGGTLSGVAKFLKQKKPQIKIIAVEPEESPIISKGIAGPHKIQGIGANFLPKNLNTKIIDEVFTVTSEAARATARKAATQEGLLIGLSGGAALYAAMQIGQRPEMSGKRIVVILPDSGERYLSGWLFEE